MEIQQIKQAGHLEMQINGRLDSYWADHLDSELSEAIRSGDHHIRLHAAGISFMSSAGVRILVKYWKELKKINGSFGIVQPSENVKSILELTGLVSLLTIEEEPVATNGSSVPSQTQQIGPHAFTIYQPFAGENLSCRLLGDPGRLETSSYPEAEMRSIPLENRSFAIGLGAFGKDYEDCRSRFGEFIAVAGAGAYLPTDQSNTPDYMQASGSFYPTMQALYALQVSGSFSHFMNFEPVKEEAPITLSQLVKASFEITGARSIGVVILAESAGLTGVALKRSPALNETGETPFAFPDIRNQLSFTSERAYHRCMTLVAGVSTIDAENELTAFVRPLSVEPQPTGHFHAAAFTYKALPKELMLLDETVSSLFDQERLQGVLHLINDWREFSGAGESEFIRGAMWVGPINTVSSCAKEQS